MQTQLERGPHAHPEWGAVAGEPPSLGGLPLHFELRACPACAASGPTALVFSDINRREGLAVSAALVECGACEMRFVNPAPDQQTLDVLYGHGLVDPVPKSPVSTGTTTGGSAGQAQAQTPGVDSCPEERPRRVLPPVRSLMRRLARPANYLMRGRPHDWPDEPGNGRSILDFGCLDGGKLVHWHARGWRVAGIDLNEAGIAAAHRRMPEGKFWCGDVRALDIAERFDVIRADNVIEHLLDPTSYVEALVRLLKPGGTLRVFTPNGQGFSARVLGKYSCVFWMPFHINVFGARQLAHVMRRAGLRDVRVTTYSPVGFWLHSLRQLFLAPGYDRRPRGRLDTLLRKAELLCYPGETLVQWVGWGEELVGTGRWVERPPAARVPGHTPGVRSA
jgi:2-polyprenyl-3-methyl-5-hydroxy-6-metoxy-1,4-benzoquinol methylase